MRVLLFKSVNHTSCVSSAKCSSCLEIPVLNYQYFILNTRFYNSEIHTPTQFAATHKINLSETTFSNVEPTAKRMSTFSINGETQFVSREGWRESDENERVFTSKPINSRPLIVMKTDAASLGPVDRDGAAN